MRDIQYDQMVPKPEDDDICGTCGVLHKKELTEANERIAELERIIGDWEIFCSTLQDWNKYKQEGDATIHPEDYCHRCGNPNIVWHAPNSLWNRVIVHKPSILCPVCFVIEAEKSGVKPCSWLLTDDDFQSRLDAAAYFIELALKHTDSKRILITGALGKALEALTGETGKE